MAEVLTMFSLFAHGEEGHAETSVSLLSQVLHQPTWVGLLVVITLLSVVYLLLRPVKLAARLLMVVGLLIIIGVAYLPHNPTVTAIILSAGFVITFLLTFTLLGGKVD